MTNEPITQVFEFPDTLPLTAWLNDELSGCAIWTGDRDPLGIHIGAAAFEDGEWVALAADGQTELGRADALDHLVEEFFLPLVRIRDQA